MPGAQPSQFEQSCPMRFMRARGFGARSTRRAAALLEVVMALSILLLAMVFVGGAFRNGSLFVERAERIARATQLAERLLGEMSTGITVVGEQESIGSFGDESMPGMCWRAVVSQNEGIPGLLNIEVEVFMGSADSKPEEREVVMSTYAQQATFIPLNMQRDFGMTSEQLELFTQSIPGGQAVFDPTSFDPRTIARMDMDSLKALLPILIQAFGGQAVAEHLDEVMKAVQTGDAAALQGLVQEGVQQQTPQGAEGQSPTAPPQQNPPRRGAPGQTPPPNQPKSQRSGGSR